MPPKIQKFEYLKIKATYSNWNQLLTAGEDGWELICETFDYWVFKRVKG